MLRVKTSAGAALGAAILIGAGTLAAGAARAAVITFETVPQGLFSGPATESGFTFSRLSGGLYVNVLGNPNHDMEGYQDLAGGVLAIVAAAPGTDFTFAGLDYAAYDRAGTGSQTLTVTGLLGGSVVATDTYTLANTSVYLPQYANWTTEHASSLAGKTIDELRIGLNAGLVPQEFNQSIDNVVLESTAVPEPASLALLGGALLGLTLLRRT